MSYLKLADGVIKYSYRNNDELFIKYFISNNNKSIKSLVIGVENGFAGKCSGSLLDANNMTNLLSKYSEVTTLVDDKATALNVYNNLLDTVNSDLAIIYYSGHGSQVADTDHDEDDRLDEFLCCYDLGLKDDDIWNAINTSKGSVFLIFDCCHSKTMFRSINNNIFKSPLSKYMNSRSNISILCWSGCPDNNYSYGSSTGGMFTNTLLKYFDEDLTYRQLWEFISSDHELASYQLVQSSNINQFNENNKIITLGGN